MEDVVIVKDPIFKKWTSFAFILGFILYHLVMATANVDESEPAPVDDKISERFKFFFKHMVSVYWWTAVSLGLTLILLLVFKFMILNVVKLDGNLFKHMDGAATSDTLTKLSANESGNDARILSSADVIDMVFSFLTSRDGAMFLSKVFMGSVLITAVFAAMVPTAYMAEQKTRVKATRMYYLALTSQILFMYALFGLVSSTQ